MRVLIELLVVSICWIAEIRALQVEPKITASDERPIRAPTVKVGQVLLATLARPCGSAGVLQSSFTLIHLKAIEVHGVGLRDMVFNRTSLRPDPSVIDLGPVSTVDLLWSSSNGPRTRNPPKRIVT